MRPNCSKMSGGGFHGAPPRPTDARTDGAAFRGGGTDILSARGCCTDTLSALGPGKPAGGTFAGGGTFRGISCGSSVKAQAGLAFVGNLGKAAMPAALATLTAGSAALTAGSAACCSGGGGDCNGGAIRCCGAMRCSPTYGEGCLNFGLTYVTAALAAVVGVKVTTTSSFQVYIRQRNQCDEMQKCRNSLFSR